MSASLIDEILVFDLWGTYGHFRRLESTTSPLTYSIPTGTAMAGIIAAFIGLDRDSYYNQFTPDKFRYSLEILSPIRKVRLNISLIRTKGGFFLRGIENPRTLIPYEFLANPQYRIYVWLKEKELFRKLVNFIKEHRSFYTPYLGIAQLIADFKFVDLVKKPTTIKEPEKRIRINSIFDKKYGKLIPEARYQYLIERIPRYFESDRVVQSFVDVIIEANGKPLLIELKNNHVIYRLGDKNIAFI